MSRNADTQAEVAQLRRLLHRMADLAEHASQTGSFKGGAQGSVRRYNAVVERLEDLEAVPEDVFQKLDEDDANFDELGAEARLLEEYLEDEEQRTADPAAGPKKMDMQMIVGLAPFMDKQELAALLRAAMSQQKTMNPGLLVGLAPFIDRQDLGRIVRERMPEWFGSSAGTEEASTTAEEGAGKEGGDKEWLSGWLEKQPWEESREAARAERETARAERDVARAERDAARAEREGRSAPEPPPPPGPPAPPPPTGNAPGAAQIEARVAEISARIQSIAAQLAWPELTDQERKELADEVARLGREQADLAADRARNRGPAAAS